MRRLSLLLLVLLTLPAALRGQTLSLSAGAGYASAQYMMSQQKGIVFGPYFAQQSSYVAGVEASLSYSRYQIGLLGTYMEIDALGVVNSQRHSDLRTYSIGAAYTRWLVVSGRARLGIGLTAGLSRYTTSLVDKRDDFRVQMQANYYNPERTDTLYRLGQSACLLEVPGGWQAFLTPRMRMEMPLLGGLGLYMEASLYLGLSGKLHYVSRQGHFNYMGSQAFLAGLALADQSSLQDLPVIQGSDYFHDIRPMLSLGLVYSIPLRQPKAG